jgi:hypothetical protein
MLIAVIAPLPETDIVAVAAAPLPKPVSLNATVGADVYPEPKVFRTTVWIARVAVAAFWRLLTGASAVPSRMVTEGAAE